MTDDAHAAKRPSRAGVHAHRTLRIFIWAGILLALAVGGFALRLAFGPVSVAFLEPYLKDRLEVGGSAVEIDFDDVTLALRRPTITGRRIAPGLEIRLTNLAVMSKEGGAVARLPEGAVTLSVSALMGGEIAARSLELRGLAIATVWRDGELFTALSASETDSSAIREVILRLLFPAEGKSYLRQVRIRDAAFVVREATTDGIWRFESLNLDLKRNRTDLTLVGDSTLHGPGGTQAPISIDGAYAPESGESRLVLAFDSLNLTAMAGNSELLSRLKGVDMAATGTVSLSFNADSALTAVTADIDAGKGTVTIPDRYAEPLAFDRLAAKAAYAPDTQTIAIEMLEARFAGAQLTLDGAIRWENDQPAVRLQGAVGNVSFKSLPLYWPAGAAPGALDWIKRNIPSGTVTTGVFVVDIPVLPEGQPLPDNAFDFQFDFKDLETHYLRPMPPITGGAGHAHLTLQDLTVNVAAGIAGDVDIAGSKVHLYDIHVPRGAKAHVAAKLQGTLPAILTLIDSEPLGYTSKYGVDPAHFDGRGVAALRLDFPLLKTVTLNDVDFDVKADVLDLKIAQLFEGVDLSAAKLALAVDGAGITGKGDIKLNDTAFGSEWREDFKAKNGLPTHYILTGPVEGPGWKVLSLPFEEVVTGPVMVRLDLLGRGPAISRGNGAFDFWSAAVGVPSLGWEKEAHKPGLARFAFDRSKDNALMINDLVYEDQALRMSGKITLGGKAGPKEVVIDSLKVGATLLAATASERTEGGYAIAVTAESFDARPFLNRLFAAAEKEPRYPDFDLDIMAAKVAGLHDVTLKDVEATARFTDGQWEQAKAAGAFSDGGNVNFTIDTPQNMDALPTRARHFNVSSDAAAKVVRVLGLFPDAIGGKLDFSGVMTPPGPAQVITGEIKINDFRVVRTPVLARILAVGSLTGVSDLLSGEGIRFQHLRTPLEVSDGVLAFKNARAWGPAIGITADGKISLTRGDAAFSGSVVPAYTANTILGKLPIVGDLIMGGKGEGLFAFTYSVTGKLDNPEVSVNPLSVLTPGFLRGIFEGSPKLEEEKEMKGKK